MKASRQEEAEEEVGSKMGPVGHYLSLFGVCGGGCALCFF